MIVIGSEQADEIRVYNYDSANDVWVPIPGAYNTGDEGSAYGVDVDINASGTELVVAEFNTGKVKTYPIGSS